MVRLFAFVRFYPWNITFESTNSLGLFFKLITSWRTLSTEPSLTLVSFFLPFSRSIAYYFNLPAIRRDTSGIIWRRHDGCTRLAAFDFASRHIFSSAGSCQYPIVLRGICRVQISRKRKCLLAEGYLTSENATAYRGWIILHLDISRFTREKRENEIIFVIVRFIDHVPQLVDCE